jgi:hypothetical protein
VHSVTAGYAGDVRRRWAALVMTALTGTLSACDATVDGGPERYDRALQRAIPRVEEATGLSFKSPPRYEVRSREQVQEFVRAQLASERARTTFAALDRVYKVLGLLPDSVMLGTVLERALSEQVVGYYDPKTKLLYVVDSTSTQMLDIVMTHELTHALQDQYLNIDSIQNAVDDGDRQSAAGAIIEGQGVYAQLRATIGETALRMGGWERTKLAMRDAQEGSPQFGSVPMIVRESLLFPYVTGADFVFRFTARRPGENVLADLPLSTRQVLNDGAYFGSGDTTLSPADRKQPVRVQLPAPSRGRVAYENNFGELGTRLMLYEYEKREVLAARAATGLAGDRYQLVEVPGGDALVWASVWDNTVEAAEFVDQFALWLKRRYPEASTRDPQDAALRRWRIAPSKIGWVEAPREMRVEVVTRGARPMVLIVDAPVGQSEGLVDAGRVVTADSSSAGVNE